MDKKTIFIILTSITTGLTTYKLMEIAYKLGKKQGAVMAMDEVVELLKDYWPEADFTKYEDWKRKHNVKNNKNKYKHLRVIK